MGSSNQEKENQGDSLNKFEAHKLNLKGAVKGGGGTTEMASSSLSATSSGYTPGNDWDFHNEY